MKRISPSDLLSFYEYEKIRPRKVEEIIELKRRRRLRVGELVSFIFENYRTVWFQIQEIIRTEKLFREEDIEKEIEVYSFLLPQENQLSATMFIEIPHESGRDRLLRELVGIHDRVYMDIGNRHSLRGVADPRSGVDYRTGRASTVHFLKWNLTPQQIEDFRQDAVRLRVDHDHYRAAAEIPPPVKEELLKDLVGG